MFWVWCQ